jgi:hypothetical protein
VMMNQLVCKPQEAAYDHKSAVKTNSQQNNPTT